MADSTKSPKVSVIVPCYNVEPYIGECLNSLVLQTIQDIEILVVDNNSTDGTKEIVLEFAAKNPGKIKTLHEPKQGISHARNLGLSRARGEYVGFVDGDDYVRFRMFENMYAAAREFGSDLVLCGRIGVYESNIIVNESARTSYQAKTYEAETLRKTESDEAERTSHQAVTSETSCTETNEVAKISHKVEADECTDIHQNMPLLLDCCMHLANKLYRREVITSNGLLFDTELGAFEDRLFNAMYLYHAKNIVQVKEPLCLTRIGRPGAVTAKYDRHILYQVPYCEKVADYYRRMGVFDLFKEQLLWMQVGRQGFKGKTGAIFGGQERILSIKYTSLLYGALKRNYGNEWKTYLKRHGANGNRFLIKKNTYLTFKSLVALRALTPKPVQNLAYRLLKPVAVTAVKAYRLYKYKLRGLIKQTLTVRYYYKRSVKNNVVLLESMHGRAELNCIILKIAQELCKKEYGKFTVYLSVQKRYMEELMGKLPREVVKKVHPVPRESLKYWRILYTAGTLYNDSTFPVEFVKKEGQVYVNTWHGYPLKALGYDNKDLMHENVNVQRNFIISNYLVCSGRKMLELLRKSYFLDNLFNGSFLCTGFPRNDIFFDTANARSLRSGLGLDGKHIIAYMPTFRGSFANTARARAVREVHENLLTQFLQELDSRLQVNQTLYLNLHYYISSKVDYAAYSHIKPFPNNIAVYDFLNICDVLITDYSSVMYDFALTKRKVILFVYDKEEYESERGFYSPLDGLPFAQATTVDEVMYEMAFGKEPDYSQVIEECMGYEKGSAAKDICLYVQLGKGQPKLEKAGQNGLDNVLVFGGSLAKNGVTTALLGYYANIDLTKRNYFNCFARYHFNEKTNHELKKVPKNVPLIGIHNQGSPTFFEQLAKKRYDRKKNPTLIEEKLLKRFYRREWKKNFGSVRFTHMLHFCGYTIHPAMLLEHFEGIRFLWCHNDIASEIRERNIIGFNYKKLYSECDVVPNVSRGIMNANKRLTTNNGRQMEVLYNFHDHDGAVQRSREELVFDDDTESTHTCEDLFSILESRSMVFITIGRFSKEKGHERLIRAFMDFRIEHPDSYLVILGGHGPLYGATRRQVANIGGSTCIVVIKSLINPMPLLAKCDLHIFPSFYEGFGLVLLEAESLGVPTLATRIPGPTEFMEEHGGYLCDNCEAGLLQGMFDFVAGRIKPLGIDFGRYNQNTREKFEILMKIKQGDVLSG